MFVSNWLTHWLTHSCLVNLIDVTLACEDAYSKFVEAVTVAGVIDEDRVGNSLLQIWKQKFGFITKLQLPSMHQTVANTILIINISNSKKPQLD